MYKYLEGLGKVKIIPWSYLDRSDFDLMVANYDGFDVYLQGTTLYCTFTQHAGGDTE